MNILRKIWAWIQIALFGPKKIIYPFIDNTNNWEKIELEILALLNTYRVKNGLGTLTGDQGIRDESLIRCDFMVEQDSLSHDGFVESSQRLKDKGLLSTGEIIAYGYPSANFVVNAWKKSKEHNQLILTSLFTHCGIATKANSKSTKYFCVIFGK